MSNIATVTASLETFIRSNIYIGQKDLDPPSHWQSATSDGKLENTLMVMPAYELVYNHLGNKVVEGSDKFRFQIKYRMPGQLSYHDLNISDFEKLAQYLQIYPIISLAGCAESGIKSVQSSQVDYPIVIEREERDQQDWIIYINLELFVIFSVTEFDVPDQFAIADLDGDNYPGLQSLGMNTYRAKIAELDNNVLDYSDNIFVAQDG